MKEVNLGVSLHHHFGNLQPAVCAHILRSAVLQNNAQKHRCFAGQLCPMDEPCESTATRAPSPLQTFFPCQTSNMSRHSHAQQQKCK